MPETMRSRARWGYWVATISDFLLGIEKRGVTVTWYYFVKNFTRSYLGADQWPQGQRRRRRSHVSCDSCLMWLMSHVHCHDHFHASHPTMVWFRKLSGNNVEVSFDCVCYAFAVDVQPVHLCFFWSRCGQRSELPVRWLPAPVRQFGFRS